MNVERDRNNGERGQIEVFVLKGTDILLYQDEGMKRLTELYDSSTYTGQLMTGYYWKTEIGTEDRLRPFPWLGEAYGKYYGLDREGLNKIIRDLKGHRRSLLPEDLPGVRPIEEILPDVRIVEYEGRQVFFPTEAMLDNFNVQRRPLPPAPQNRPLPPAPAEEQ